MKHRQLGRSGPQVSEIGLGCSGLGGAIDARTADALVGAALDVGITLFDTADSYGQGRSETSLGAALTGRRHGALIATKFGTQMDHAGWLKGASGRYIVQAVEASLTRLRTDRIDLYQLHWPDPLTPIQETLEALERLVRAGKVLHTGCSNFSAAQIIEADLTAHQLGLHGFVSLQAEYSLLARHAELDLLPAVAACGIGLLPYLPLAAGLLAKPDIDPQTAPPGSRQARVEKLAARFAFQDQAATPRLTALRRFAAANGRPLLSLAFGWLLDHEIVASVIAGASTAAQVRANAAAASRGSLTPDERVVLDRLTSDAAAA
ncbi:MAG: aldo/keto reductase [Alphaproteobacteria bacterium]|nr:aldo/keto reductase [Alphaproteobacteria bacterium]